MHLEYLAAKQGKYILLLHTLDAKSPVSRFFLFLLIIITIAPPAATFLAYSIIENSFCLSYNSLTTFGRDFVLPQYAAFIFHSIQEFVLAYNESGEANTRTLWSVPGCWLKPRPLCTLDCRSDCQSDCFSNEFTLLYFTRSLFHHFLIPLVNNFPARFINSLQRLSSTPSRSIRSDTHCDFSCVKF